MSEKTLTITEVTEKNGWYAAVATDGNKYSTKDAGIKAFVGKTAVFITGSKPRSDGKGTNYYVNTPFPPVPTEAVVGNQGNSGIPKEKIMVLSYAKDLIGDLINSAQLKYTNLDDLAAQVILLSEKLYNSVAAEEPPA